MLVRYDGYKKGNDRKEASISDYPSWSEYVSINYHFETVAMAHDKNFNFGTLHWGFTLDWGKIKDEYWEAKEGVSQTFKSALSKFNKFYKNYHIVSEGETILNIAKLYYNDENKWREIQKANGLKNDQISIGQKLIIPSITLA